MLKSPLHGLLRTGATAALLASLAVATGCPQKQPPPPPPPPPPAPAPPPPEPDPVTTDSLLQDMQADPRVQFPQSKAPTDESFARAVIRLSDAIVRGDAGALRPMLTSPARSVLEMLQSSDQWGEATSRLEAARIVFAGNNPMGGSLAVIALQEPDGAYILGWAATKVGDTWVFGNAPTSADIRRRASEWDNVSAMGMLMAQFGDAMGDLDLPPELLEEVEKALNALGQTGEGEGEGEDPQNPGPRRRNTPGGPVTIPGGS